MFAVNVIGAFLCAREAIKRMSTKHGGKGGAIVNVSSGAARLGSPGEYVDYAASKGAIDTMTIGLAKELAADGIRVNCVRPGFVHTDIHAAGGEPNRIERLRDSIPMKRGGEPDEVARAILWLLSDEASYSTGAILDVTGGR
jgi:NAD(P)-dependent dehydrogenase (short-subunit alcohol dehydrogenase family)